MLAEALYLDIFTISFCYWKVLAKLTKKTVYHLSMTLVVGCRCSLNHYWFLTTSKKLSGKAVKITDRANGNCCPVKLIHRCVSRDKFGNTLSYKFVL